MKRHYVIGHREPVLQLTTPTLWCRPRRSWCRWVRPCLFQSICPLRCGRCWPRCQPSDSECQRSCHLWDVATTWHPDVERRRSDRKKADISRVVDLSYVPYSLMTVFYVSFWMSACHQPPPPRGPQTFRWVKVPERCVHCGNVRVTVDCVIAMLPLCTLATDYK